MDITAQTKVGALLDAHPELEDALIALVPAFVKLRNPILRATVAKVATLEQAARVGGIPLPTLINGLRQALGQAPEAPGAETLSRAQEALPPWFSAEAVARTLDVGEILAAGGHPLAQAKQALNAHPPGAIVVLISDFEPAPLLSLVEKEGLMAACVKAGSRYRTLLKRP
ncbi:MAG: DUF1858 domain-containing protein [Acidobacteria bacterium]|nr:DUF1858 domain-containing protein [Acidobacteriota bacterium]MBI3487126.1 DUF1858 domain-containing protein [Acidobacteriota bacterium]